MPVINARIDHCDYVRSRAGRNIPGRCYADVGAAGAGEAPNGLAGVLESPQLPEARVIGHRGRVDDVVGSAYSTSDRADSSLTKVATFFREEWRRSSPVPPTRSDSSISSAAWAWRTD